MNQIQSEPITNERYVQRTNLVNTLFKEFQLSKKEPLNKEKFYELMSLHSNYSESNGFELYNFLTKIYDTNLDNKDFLFNLEFSKYSIFYSFESKIKDLTLNYISYLQKPSGGVILDQISLSNQNSEIMLIKYKIGKDSYDFKKSKYDIIKLESRYGNNKKLKQFIDWDFFVDSNIKTFELIKKLMASFENHKLAYSYFGNNLLN